MSAQTRWPCRVSSSASLRVDLVVQRSGDIGSPRTSGLNQREKRLVDGQVQFDDTFAAGAGPADASQRDVSGGEFAYSGRHPGLTDTGGAGDRSDPAMAEGLGLRPYQQATLRSSRCGRIAPNFAASTARCPSSALMPDQRTTEQKATS